MPVNDELLVDLLRSATGYQDQLVYGQDQLHSDGVRLAQQIGQRVEAAQRA